MTTVSCGVFYDLRTGSHVRRATNEREKQRKIRDKTTRILCGNRVDGWINKEFIVECTRISHIKIHAVLHANTANRRGAVRSFRTKCENWKMRKKSWCETIRRRSRSNNFIGWNRYGNSRGRIVVCISLLNIYHGLFKLQFIFIRLTVRRRRRRALVTIHFFFVRSPCSLRSLERQRASLWLPLWRALNEFVVVTCLSMLRAY